MNKSNNLHKVQEKCSITLTIALLCWQKWPTNPTQLQMLKQKVVKKNKKNKILEYIEFEENINEHTPITLMFLIAD